MIVKECIGYELEKAKSNTSEDFFNRSELTFLEEGEEKTFHVLYIRYFDELFSSFTPYENDPIFTVGSRDVHFKDIVALVCLLKNPGFRHRKRVYINNQKEFEEYFKGIQYDKLIDIFANLEQNKKYDLASPLAFIQQ
ncbi:hypothetical protein [Fredinandcohnia quinoae]|uniref:Uncharacterized protein n=1 Tax=Fredinandcohnia quinoae TaxID=2918902 RepID=A0AAW5E4I0_9BACI|nr:hypothetical protein [Fredinandcohnia sp. SECRCQ15]MCH1624802.1 hypothetical protein [Fredinandcohnia sp. SECRCQ15]